MAIHALVVDDDPVTRGLVAEQLISLQVSTVRTVESGRAALDVLRQHAQINLLVDTLLASFLVTGSISWLYYSDRLVEFPLGVFGIALATVILPSLSQKHAEASGKAFSDTIDWALRWVGRI